MKNTIGILGVLLVTFVVLTGWGATSVAGIVLALFWLGAALYARFFPTFQPFCYPLVVLGCVTTSMYFPGMYRVWFGQNTTDFVTPILQVIMFGMGTQLAWKDFRQIAIQPWGVFIGVGLQFCVMPLVGFFIVSVFSFPKEVAAGILLVGCVPSGIASNVMNFLARSNVALSVTLTTVATLLGPILTPLWMKILIGDTLELDYTQMAWTILNLVVLPILAGLLVKSIFLSRLSEKARIAFERFLGFFSMVGLLLTIVFINAAGRDALLSIGFLLILACLLHNTLGYFLGYVLAKCCGLDESSCRTVSIEVGMQNGGLAAGIATQLGKAATMGLAPAICSPLMNITGASLAIWWRGRRS
ncbi:MAG: bile acid:sodium symporter family protein [Planctomycetia bacterium]|nr:bile acid:sodium symporter family protein [Planctomycetia bacterium]